MKWSTSVPAGDLVFAASCLVLSAAAAVGYVRSSQQYGASAPVDVGDRLSAPCFDQVRAEASILLLYRSDCRFCQESMPFYTKLAQVAGAAGVPLRVLVPEAEDDARTALGNANVAVESVTRCESFGPFRGTPVIIALDANARVVGTWLGRQGKAGEGQILAAVARLAR